MGPPAWGHGGVVRAGPGEAVFRDKAIDPPLDLPGTLGRNTDSSSQQAVIFYAMEHIA